MFTKDRLYFWVMKFRVIIILLLLSAFNGHSQENTLGIENKSSFQRDTLFYPEENSRLLIVPFDPKLYRSEIDEEIGKYNQLNFQELRGYYRLGLDNALYLAAKNQYEVIRLHADNADINKDLNSVYKSTAYEAREIIVEDQAKKTKMGQTVQKVKTKIKPETEPEDTETRIENGQIITGDGTVDKYMARTIVKKNVLDYCEEKYKAGLFLFINQLDLMNEPGVDWTQFSNKNYNRVIRVHFSIYNKNEKELYSGVATTLFPAETNDIRDIIANHFTEAAAQIINKVPVLMIQQSENLIAD